MAVIVSNNAYIAIGSSDLTDHCTELRVNDGQETVEMTTLNSSVRLYRAAMGTASVEATFLNDHSTGSIENRLRSCILFANGESTSIGPTPTATGTTGTAGSLIAGAYKYWVTYLWPAMETAPGAAGTFTIAATTGSIALSNITASTEWQVWGRRLYRTSAGGSSDAAVELETIKDNSTTTYTDSAASSSISGNNLISAVSRVTGFSVVARKLATPQGAENPQYELNALVDGDINVLDEKPGELGTIKVKFVPFGLMTVSVTS